MNKYPKYLDYRDSEPDRTEYCNECKVYHNPPTWPNCTARLTPGRYYAVSPNER